jgi:hypothetical protein
MLRTLQPEERIQAEVRRTRERAAKRLQTLTKEVDWQVAEAYVALADDPEELELAIGKRKESGYTAAGKSHSDLERVALDWYLDDDSWEAAERREGRGVELKSFP